MCPPTLDDPDMACLLHRSRLIAIAIPEGAGGSAISRAIMSI